MSSFKFDRKVWTFIKAFYEKSCGEIEKKRKENQLEAYWCRPEGNDQKLFAAPKQRVFARFLRSYLNTTWHKIGKGNGSIIHWFNSEDIIKEAESKSPSLANKPLSEFCKSILDFIGKLELKNYNFEQEQTENFKIFSDSVGEIFNELQKTQKDLPKSQKVSVYEEIIYENTCEPYQTIMKMQKLFPGFGIALSCDFLKESHFCNIAKPDIHLCHVFSLIDGIPYSMDLALVKRVAEFAVNVCPENENDFCNTGAYNVDKIIWLICSESNNTKTDFLENLNNWCQKQENQNEDR